MDAKRAGKLLVLLASSVLCKVSIATRLDQTQGVSWWNVIATSMSMYICDVRQSFDADLHCNCLILHVSKI